MPVTRPRRISGKERRARLARRHHLATAARAPVDVAEALVGIHSTDPRTVFLSIWARMRSVDVTAIEDALYEERAIVRMLGMRRTLFVVPREVVPVVQAACSEAIARRERRRIIQVIEQSNPRGDAAHGLRDAERRALRVITERGEAVGAEITKADPALAKKIVMARGTRFETEVSIGSRALVLLSMEARIVRGRPRGTWVSSQYRWTPAQRWFTDRLPRMTAAEAQAELVRRWLRSYGPGTTADLRWWTGLTAREIARALEAVKPAEVDLDGASGWVLTEDLDPVRSSRPHAVLLPSLDSTVMGWTERGWYLGEHGPALFDRSGNAGPTVWWDGRVVGAWSQRKTGEILFRLLEAVGSEATAAIEAEAERLHVWLGDTRVIPRFPTPLEAELRSA
ncbi:MAG: winged helix DNA-binding domain-containing protein [Actinomycetota bacterium]